MTPEELDTEALRRARAALIGDMDDVTDDEIRNTTMYAVTRFNLACVEFARIVVEVLTERFDRMAAALRPPEDT